MSATAIAPRAATTPVAAPPDVGPTQAKGTEPLAFAHAPCLYAACSFALGISAGRLLYEPPPLAICSLLLAALLAAVAGRRAPRIAMAPLTLAWLAGGLFCAEIHPAADPQRSLQNYASQASHTWQGEVVRAAPIRTIDSTAPYSTHAVRETSQSLDLRIHPGAPAADLSQSSLGGVRLVIYSSGSERPREFHCGERLQFTVPLRLPERYNDPGVWDASAYLLEQGIGVLGSAKAAAIVVLPGPTRPTLACRLKTLQQKAAERIIGLAATASDHGRVGAFAGFFQLTKEDASMLTAMVTGDRSWLLRRTRVGFERTGSFHLLVVSGLHLAIFAGIIFWLAQRIGLARGWSSVITIAAAFGYAVFTGFGQPVQRSFWMVTLYLLGRLLWRERSPLNAIGFAALCLLAARPPGLFDAGFQMTLLSVLAIAGIAAPLAERSFAPYLRATRNLSLIAIDASLPPRVAQFRVSLRLLATHLRPLAGKTLALHGPAVLIRFGLRILELLLVSVVVEIVMSLPMALYFHRITLLALPVNFLIVPFLGLLLPCALLTFAALLVSAKLAAVPAAITAGLLHTVTGLIHVFATLQAADLRVPGPAALPICAFVALLGLAIHTVRWRRYAFPVCGATLLLMATIVVLPRRIARQANTLEITVIDVGQGDSLLIVTPEGKTVLIDAGGSPFGPPPGIANFDIGEEVVSAYLWSRGIRRLDAVALTHAHADHIGGMPAVLANFRPREIWVGTNPHSTAYDAFLAEAEDYGAILEHHTAGDHLRFGGADVEVLAPEAGYRPGPVPSNNDSLVLKFQYGHTSALLEGDAEAPSEEQMERRGGLRSDLLKVGHHGSRTSTTAAFLAAVSPSFAAISVGRHNLYGHPRIEVLEELQHGHIHSYRTDMLGLSSFYLDGSQVEAGPFPAR